MCETCAFVAAVFAAARQDPHRNFAPTLKLLEELTHQQRLELFAGDCPTGQVLQTLSSERHYTVRLYFACKECGGVHFTGGCIRGTPLFQAGETLDGVELEQILWGREGSYFREHPNET